MSPVIKAEKLGKKYLLRHDNAAQFPTLRDALTETVKGVFRPGTRRRGGEREEFWALRDLSLEIGEGDRVGIIGRNGAGKSTLLKILSRITEPSAGQAIIRGRVASLLEVGTGFHPELTGRENVFLNGAILGMSRAEIARKFDEIVAFAEVERFLDTPVKRYSSGMYVRLAFAVAAHLEPEVLIVDEVLSVGDAQFQAKCLGKMKEVGGEGRTVLFVSHNMHAVRSLCDKGVLIDRGTVAETGPAAAVIDSYHRKHRNDASCVSFPDDSDENLLSVVEASICDGSGTPNGIFHVGDDIHFRIRIRRSAPVDPQVIALNLSSAEGMVLSNIHSGDAAFRFEAGRREESFTVKVRDVRYYPGEYSVSVVMKLPNGKHVFKNDCLSFSMLQDTDAVSRPLVRSQGMFFLDSEWSR